MWSSLALAMTMALPPTQDASVAETATKIFLDVCVRGVGERSLAADLASERGWQQADLADYPEFEWVDLYRTGSGTLVLGLSSAQQLPSQVPGFSVSKPAVHQCTIYVESSSASWQTVAAILDASDLMVRRPDPAAGVERHSLREYDLVSREARGGRPKVTIVEETPDVVRVSVHRYP